VNLTSLFLNRRLLIKLIRM